MQSCILAILLRSAGSEKTKWEIKPLRSAAIFNRAHNEKGQPLTAKSEKTNGTFHSLGINSLFFFTKTLCCQGHRENDNNPRGYCFALQQGIRLKSGKAVNMIHAKMSSHTLMCTTFESQFSFIQQIRVYHRRTTCLHKDHTGLYGVYGV